MSNYYNEASEFAKKHILPYSKEIDEKEEFPVKSFEEMGKAGYFKVMIPKEYGGQGGTLEDHAELRIVEKMKNVFFE